MAVSSSIGLQFVFNVYFVCAKLLKNIRRMYRTSAFSTGIVNMNEVILIRGEHDRLFFFLIITSFIFLFLNGLRFVFMMPHHLISILKSLYLKFILYIFLSLHYSSIRKRYIKILLSSAFHRSTYFTII